jgi:hypothetical protein
MCRGDVVRFCQCLLPTFIETVGQFGPGHKSVTLAGKIVARGPNPTTERGFNFPKVAELRERKPGTALAHVSGTPGQEAQRETTPGIASTPAYLSTTCTRPALARPPIRTRQLFQSGYSPRE